MEEPTRNMQLALASLVGLVIGTLVSLYLVGSGVTPTEIPLLAGPMNAVFVALAFIAGALMWWRHSYGYIVGLVTGILFLVNMGFLLSYMAAGDIPSEWLVLSIPGIFFGLVFLGSTYLAWRE